MSSSSRNTAMVMSGAGGQSRAPESYVARIWNSAWILLILGNLFWAGNIIVGRVLLAHVPALALSFWRWTGAFAFAFWFAWPHLKRDWPILLAHWKLMLILAATGIAFFNAAAYIGLAHTTALNVLLMQSSLPLIATIWAFLLFRDRPRAWQLAGVAVSVTGAALIAAHGSVEAFLALRFHRADLWILASAFILGVYMVVLRLRPDVHPLSFMQVMMGLGAILVAPAFLWEHAQGARIEGGWENIAGIVYMAIFPSFISYLFFNRAVELIGAAPAGQSTHLIPLFGSVMAVLLLGESPHLYHLAGAALIATGIGLARAGTPART